MNTAARELEVPEVALDELYTHRNDPDRAAAVRAVATPVVITELRRLAAEYCQLANISAQLIGGTYLAAAGIATRRADKLEAGQ